MPVHLLYVDSSALVKLVVVERETEMLERALESWPELISSVVTEVEVMRVARRSGIEQVVDRARRILQPVTLVELHDSIRLLAGQVDPPTLRTLDAIHLATARSMGDDLGGFAAYDAALAEAAEAAGLTVVAPS